MMPLAERNILQITNGAKDSEGYHFPTINMYKQNKIKIYMTKASGEYYKKTATL